MEAEVVAVGAEAGDLAEADSGDDGLVAEGFAGFDVGEVDFDGGEIDGGDGVAEGVAVVGEGAGVDEEAVGPGAGVVDGVDEDAFVVGLLVAEFGVVLGGEGGELLVDVGEGEVAVDVGFTGAEKVEVGAVKEEDLVGHYFSSCGRVINSGGMASESQTSSWSPLAW